MFLAHVVPPFAARISRFVADVQAPGGDKWERLKAGESNGKLPLRIAQDAVCQSHTGHMTGLWFLPPRPLRLHTNEWWTNECNWVLWSKDVRNERKLNIYNALIKSSLLYGSETWRLTENNKRRVEATEMDALRRSCRISRKERIRNVTIRQQIGLEETILKKLNRTSLHGTAMFKEWQKEDNPK